MTTLHVFPDTNLFIQCHPLEQLDWSRLGDYDDIRLIVCRTVQREIDRNKTRGNDRVGRRSRDAYSRFRGLALRAAGAEVVNVGPPRVTIELAGPGRPSQELEGNLDYRHGDDELIGYAHAFSSGRPKQDVSLLTHDSGLMMTASTLGLPVIPIHDDWLVPPENAPHERKLARLQQEVETLRRQEPRFESDFIDAAGNRIEYVELTLATYQPLTSGQLASAMDRLRDTFPMVTDFGPPSIDGLSQIVANIEVNPAGFQQRVDRYRSTQYPEWLAKCQNILGNLHRAVKPQEGWPVIAFRARNEGTRPGRDVLFEVQARGDLAIRPPLSEDVPFRDDDEEDVQLRLPRPPEPPRRQYVLDAFKNLNPPIGSLDLPSSACRY